LSSSSKGISSSTVDISPACDISCVYSVSQHRVTMLACCPRHSTGLAHMARTRFSWRRFALLWWHWEVPGRKQSREFSSLRRATACSTSQKRTLYYYIVLVQVLLQRRL
jgi:hypothetical protein